MHIINWNIKSSSVLEAVKKDLDELSTVVRTEVSNAGSMIGETFKVMLDITYLFCIFLKNII